MPNASKTTSPNKSAFIRSLPRSMSAAEVMAEAKAAGMTFSARYVYSIRSKTPDGGHSDGRPGPKPRLGRGALETQFIELALDLGLAKSEALLGRLRTAVRSAGIR